MNSLETYEFKVSVDKRDSPPPRVNPATPTPGERPPTTFTPVGSSASYTWPQVSPAPTSTVPHVELTFVSLKRFITISTPLVEENPGLKVCPPPFTAKGARLDPRIRSYENMGQRKLAHQIKIANNLADVLGRAWLHRASGCLGTRGSSVRNVEQVLRCGLTTD